MKKDLKKMSDTNINQYYPEEVPQSLVAGEAPGAPASQPSEESPVGAEPTRTDGEKETVNAGEGVVDLGIDLPDIPLPDDEPIEDGVKDTFDDAAFNFAIVGVGQGGSRLAESFWNLGYRRVGVINTAQQDLSLIKMPEENKLLIGDGGAGKNPDAADEVFRTRYEDILDFLKKTFGSGYERVLVCAGAGGGTGAGGVARVLEICHDLNQSLGKETKDTDAKVGCVLALPTRGEGIKVQENSKKTVIKVTELEKAGVVSPLVILDNEKIKQLYPKLSVNQFWSTANNSICSIFHLFNKISAQESAYTTFDKADLDTIFSSGVIMFGATPVKDLSETGISYAVRDNLRKNILAGVDVSTGNVAACVIIGDKESLDNIPQSSLEHGFEQLSRMMGSNSTVHRGIYAGAKKGLAVYTAIGGLQAPDNLFDYFFKVDRVYK
jgi:cell division GTPase FtsZ